MKFAAKTESTADKVAECLSPRLDRVTSLGTIPVAIDPEAEYAGIRHDLETRKDEFQAEADQKTQDALNNINAISAKQLQLEITPLNEYKRGHPVYTTIKKAPSEIADDVVNHMMVNQTRLQTLLNAFATLQIQMRLAIFAAIFLACVVIPGFAMPMLQEAAKSLDLKLTELSGIVLTTVISASIAMISASAVLRFLRGGPHSYMTPWLIMIAFGFLIFRAIGLQMGANLELFDSYPSWVRTTILTLTDIGAGIAIIVVEYGAGCALAFAWIRHEQRGDLQTIRELLNDTNDWQQARAEHQMADRVKNTALSIDNLCKTGTQIIADAITKSLVHHHKTIEKVDSRISQPPTGADIEKRDIVWLRKQVGTCEISRDQLLRLAGLQPAPIILSTPSPNPATIATI
jgi:hypothetical protein